MLSINGRFLTRPVTGVERYALEVAQYLGKAARLITPPRWFPTLFGHLWEQLWLPWLLPKGNVLWSPANSGPIHFSPHMLTVHDLSPLEHPQWYRPGWAWWYRQLWARLIPGVQVLITVSEFSKRRICDLFAIPEGRLLVAAPGVNPQVFRPLSSSETRSHLRKLGVQPPFFLFVGSLQPRKNLSCLIKAWAQFQGSHPQVHLIVVGDKRRNFHPLDLGELPAGVHLLGRVDDETLCALYSAAHGLVLPSLYEGAGLPVLEAMACGCPVIAANNTALPELVGQAGLLFDPLDADDLADAVERLWLDSALRTKLERAGRERASRFPWERTASLIWRAYQETAAPK